MFDPFAVLGLERTYDVDRARVQRAYLTEAAKWHPDRFADPVERRQAEQRSAEVNGARDILEDDEQRAEALLALLGGPGKGDDKSLPDGFLMDILDVRQQLEQAMEAGDAQARREVEQWADAQRAEHHRRVGELFGQAEQADGDSPLRAIRHELNAWRYIERLIEQIDPAHGA
ncbi:MAG: DnaJ domain-containing protein [Phycisphaerales bacterium]|nr:DnaJ domain-containing protein [Phycisphaerales bacterium]